MTSAIALAGGALRQTLRHPGLWALIYLARLAVAAGFALHASRVLGPLLEGRPPPELAGWVLLARVEPRLLVQLAIAAAGFALFHFLAGTLVAGLVLERLAGGRGEAGLRRLGQLALLRAAALLGAAALLAGWGYLAYRLGELGLVFDEPLQIGLQLALALLVGLPLVALAVSLQLAQPSVVQGRTAWRAARSALDLLHRRPGASLLLSLAGWGSTLLLACMATGSGLVLDQLLALGSAAVGVWSYSWVTKLGVSSTPHR
jgi:hypothetical protein